MADPHPRHERYSPCQRVDASRHRSRLESGGRSVFVQRGIGVPAQIERVDLTAGVRTRVVALAPPDLAGVNALWGVHWLDDGAAYTYTYGRQLSKLFVASGVRITP